MNLGELKRRVTPGMEVRVTCNIPEYACANEIRVVTEVTDRKFRMHVSGGAYKWGIWPTPSRTYSIDRDRDYWTVLTIYPCGDGLAAPPQYVYMFKTG